MCPAPPESFVPRREYDPADLGRRVDDLGLVGGAIVSMLDRSLRWMRLTNRSLVHRELTAGDPQMSRLGARIDDVCEGLRRVEDLTRAGMRCASVPLGSALPASGACVTVCDAMIHAVELLSPAAKQHHVRVWLTIDADASACPAGPLYVALLEGLEESIHALASRGGGAVEVRARREASEKALVIEIADEAPRPTSGEGPASPIARSAIAQARGRIERVTTAARSCTRITLPLADAPAVGA